MARVGLLAVGILVSSLLGCVETRPIQRDPIDATGAGGTGAGGTGAGGQGGTGSSTSGLPTYSAAEVQAVQAQCDLPHGPVAPTATWGDKRAQMVGVWLLCPPAVDTVYSPAIVFASDGTWAHLLHDAVGGLAPGQGVKNQGTYWFPYGDAEPTNGNPYVTIQAATGAWTPTDYSSPSMAFESSPSRMFVSWSYNDQQFEQWLVRFPE